VSGYEECNNRGIELSRLGKLQEAEELLMDGLVLYPEYPLLSYNLSLVYFKQDRFSEGVILLQDAVRLDPENGEFHGQLALGLYTLGRYDEAEFHYSLAVELAPEHGEIQNNRGVLFFVTGRYAEARSCFKAAVSLKSDYRDGWYNLADACDELGDRKGRKEALYRYKKLCGGDHG